MNWNEHSKLTGTHALLGASQYHWINDTDEKLKKRVMSAYAAERGTQLHDVAQRLVKLGVTFDGPLDNFKQYVNDAIGYRMRPEQVLFYSVNCYGTADAISFDGKLLRIFDLKTGKTTPHLEQLLIYASLFCLEYHVKPGDIMYDLRLYHQDGIINQLITKEGPIPISAELILPIMDKIIRYDKMINEMREDMS